MLSFLNYFTLFMLGIAVTVLIIMVVVCGVMAFLDSDKIDKIVIIIGSLLIFSGIFQISCLDIKKGYNSKEQTIITQKQNN
jgi:cytochrome c biogenesis protein CcdA